MHFLGLGGWEWLIILLVIALIFGVGRLANIGPDLGKSIRGFRKALKGEEETSESPQAGKKEKKEISPKPEQK